jgi:hypothetical protein
MWRTSTKGKRDNNVRSGNGEGADNDTGRERVKNRRDRRKVEQLITKFSNRGVSHIKFHNKQEIFTQEIILKFFQKNEF